MTEDTLTLAIQGDRKALDALIRPLRDRIYNLALRMLFHPEEDEGQILRSNPSYATPESVVSSIRTLLDEVSFRVLQ